MHKLKIRKIGNSQGVILPAEVLEGLKLKSGSPIDVSVENGVIVISPPTPSLDALISSVPKGRKLKEQKTGRAMGRER